MPDNATGCINITTTANFSGNIQVCATYDEADLSGPESGVKLMHDDGVVGTDISDLVYLVDFMFTGGPAPGGC